jgi:ABC-type bacteriocin/lantibiotic exporter with double-glycine peptidase domain
METKTEADFAGRSAWAAGALIAALTLCAMLLGSASCNAVPPRSETAVRIDVPMVRQDARYECGLASISALCQYWRVEIPDEERAVLARVAAESRGLSGNELRDVLQRLGFEVYVFEGTLDRASTGVYGHVDAGRPPLVMLGAPGAEPHYELVLGYDEPLGLLILLDPVEGEVLVPRAGFEQSWEQCRRFTLLASTSSDTQANRRPPAADTTSSSATTTAKK